MDIVKNNTYTLSNRDGCIRIYNTDINPLYIDLSGMDKGNLQTLKNCNEDNNLYFKIPISFSIICRSNLTKKFLQFLYNNSKINLQYLLNSEYENSFGYEFCNVKFPIDKQEISESDDSVVIKFNGYCYGNVNIIFKFSEGINIISN